ncbi:MFS family permease [Bradyrhizobium sp. LM3.6]
MAGPAASTNPPEIKSRIGAILRATSGNFLEQFDFFLFGFYAQDIAKAFFPAADETAALLNAYGVFWLGALMRPVGAIVLGAYIDRIGRRQGLIVTLALMALGTVVIAFCPSYAAIGVAAPIIVLIGRLIQGFSAGVELGGVSVYLSEIATPGNRGFYTSFQSSSQQVAIFVAAVIGFVLREVMPSDTFLDSLGGIAKWRIPFLIGCIIIPVIFMLRRSLEETPAFLAMKRHPTASEVFTSALANWRIVVLGMMIAVLTTTTFYFITVYAPGFGKQLNLSPTGTLLVTLFVAVTNFIWKKKSGRRRDIRPHRPQAGAADDRRPIAGHRLPGAVLARGRAHSRKAAGRADDVLVLLWRLQRHDAGMSGRDRPGTCPYHLFLDRFCDGCRHLRHVHPHCRDQTDQHDQWRQGFAGVLAHVRRGARHHRRARRLSRRRQDGADV